MIRPTERILGNIMIMKNSVHCLKCGCLIEGKAAYCGKCGTTLFHNWDYSKESDYYREKFDQFERNEGSFKLTWNWAAFFFWWMWFLIKGMWGKAIVLFFLALGLWGVRSWIAIPALWVYGGLFGNYDYYLLKKKHTQWWG
jgi:hypothetical protein